MKASEALDDAIKRMELQEMWSERLDNLNFSRAAFCERYGLNTSVLCRYEKLGMAAGWEWVNKMEKALKSEGV